MAINFYQNEKNQISVAAGDVIFEQNDAADCLYGVVSGSVHIMVEGKIVETVQPGECFERWV